MARTKEPNTKSCNKNRVNIIQKSIKKNKSIYVEIKQDIYQLFNIFDNIFDNNIDLYSYETLFFY